MPQLSDLPELLAALREQHLLREPDAQDPRAELAHQWGSEFLDVSSNDYLGLKDAGRPLASSRPVDRSPRSESQAAHQDPLAPSPGDVSRETSRAAPASERAGEPPAPPEGVSRETSAAHFAPATAAPHRDPATPRRDPATPPFSARPPLSPADLPAGAGASRLIHGTHRAHLAVERWLADWLGYPSALLFSSGYAANVGALGALLDRNDLVISDALNHASIIDGIRLSRAEVVVTPHLDLAALREALKRPTQGGRWVVLESYYSMDGDGPDLAAVRDLCLKTGAALYVDEAHALGVFGPEGTGLAAAQGVRPDVLVAAFGKAVGSHGAAVLGSDSLRTWLWNRARSFVFSTAPTPRHAAELAQQLERTRMADAERAHLEELGAAFRERLVRAGVSLSPGSFGPIVSLVVGAPERALELSSRLRARGILVQAIRPPTVPLGQSRLRLTLQAGLNEASLDRLAAIVLDELERLGEPS